MSIVTPNGRSWSYIRLFVCIGILTITLLSNINDAWSIPAFARQTGAQCASCHAGGQFPELTPYGRLFKVTGYTSGNHALPLAIMGVVDRTSTRHNEDSDGNPISELDRRFIADFASIFLAGKVNDQIGGMAQWTYTVHDRQDSNNDWQGHFGSDNFDLRYASQFESGLGSVIWGVDLNNNPTVQDPWNSSPAWGYPYLSSSTGAFASAPVSTLIEGGLAQQVAGIGLYAWIDQSWYLEFSNYRTANGFWRFLSLGNTVGDANHPLTFVENWNPYVRLAYTQSWDLHNFMVGAFLLQSRVYPFDAQNNPVFDQGATRFRDTGIDAQYQYLADPHTITAQLRLVNESIDDETQTLYTQPASLKSIKLKGSYVYDNTYGMNLSLTRVMGTTDSLAYAASALNSPDTTYWTPEIFWQPIQNARIGLQYNAFTRFLGARTNYDGAGRNASDNDTAFLYLWAAF
jgi:hypothetical protein